ncbi:MAG: Bifunctional phosphoribosylaminoimidazolecarboxamide formyltransferase/IMP cyclohydrolase [uncultured bacterium]|nr:MAG: Bifunctional phosphoribosylaminoimidazolecarboxamide formyltransferase/IMP cyclohydrolase [uncultured bacterium]OFW68141.1 MAG: hypothetical protein A2X70_05530 [Alphaproteobacteria bacterium GWC2_42_16]OFW73534.1 MAG: hypothetical protein A2Z80_06830 [Alphaproteobacteria bacterium GWA2_41_27]OFW82383.1 MAG: hypothetical protein A3E50_04230 [Alphaproteobacteria bacterium RIFCSPHIGHO2_12_FULL_42_100]OFW86209.1 MAG: hypothetical protein A2W06_01160 [Alphaproteobacteria bacterium RBG_16_42
MPAGPTLESLKKKLQKAKENVAKKTPQKNAPQTPASNFFNIGAELVAGVFVGVGIGLLMDWLFNISPWGLISFFILGSAAGMLNVYRSLQPKNTDEKKKDQDV